MKDQLTEWNKQLKQKEEALYALYKAKVRKLLIRKNAKDLLPMLGLDEEE